MNNPPFVARTGASRRSRAILSNNTAFKPGLVWQAGAGSSCMAAPTTASAQGIRRLVALIDQSAWGFDARIGWHPGVTPPRHVGARSTAATATATATAAATAGAEAATTGESEPDVQRGGVLYAEYGPARSDL